VFPFSRSLIRDGKTAQVTALETELKSLKCKLEEKVGVNEIQTAQISSLLGENTQIGEENQRKLSQAIELQTVIDKLKTEVQAKEENAARLLEEQHISLVNEHKKTVDEKEERISSHISQFTELQAKHTALMDEQDIEAQDKIIRMDELRQAHAQLSESRQQHILLTDAHRNASAHVMELQSQLASLMDNHSQLQVEEQQKIQVLRDQLKDTTHQYEKVGADLTIVEGDMRTTAAALKAMTAEKQVVVVQWEKCQMINRKTSQELSCVQDEHESAKTLLVGTRIQLQQMTAERQDVGSLLEVTKIQHATTKSELGKTSSELAKTHVELHKTKSDLKAQGDEHTRVKTFLEENKLQIQQMSAERQDVGSKFDDTKAQHATTKSELGKTTLELEKTHADLLKTTSDLKTLGDQHVSVEKLLDENKQQHVTTKSELHQTTSALGQMTAQLEDMKTQYEITKNLLSKAEAAVQKLAAEYKGLQTHLAEVQLQFEKTSADLSGLQQRVEGLEAGEIVLKASVHDLTESKVKMCTENSQKLAQKETELLGRQQVIDTHIACVGELNVTISNRDLNLEQNASVYSSELQHRINELKEKQQVIDSQAVCIGKRDADLELLAAELQAKDCALQNKDSELQHSHQFAESQASLRLALAATIKENVRQIALRDTTIEENTTQLQERLDSIEKNVTLFEAQKCALAAKEEEIVRLTTAIEDTAMHLKTAASDLASARFVASMLMRASVHCCCFSCLLLLLLLVLPVCYISFLFPNSSTGRAKTVKFTMQTLLLLTHTHQIYQQQKRASNGYRAQITTIRAHGTRSHAHVCNTSKRDTDCAIKHTLPDAQSAARRSPKANVGYFRRFHQHYCNFACHGSYFTGEGIRFDISDIAG